MYVYIAILCIPVIFQVLKCKIKPYNFLPIPIPTIIKYHHINLMICNHSFGREIQHALIPGVHFLDLQGNTNNIMVTQS